MKGHLYFVGIVGHAMRGLALASHELGYNVTGLDPGAEDGPGTEWLAAHNLQWTRDFKPGMLDGVTAVIITGIPIPDEVLNEAKHRQIPVKSYAALFGELTAHRHVIAVAGTHGKTTTTSLIAWLLESAGRRPDYLVGIKPFNFESSVRLAGSDVVVAEGDEYKSSPLDTTSKVQHYHPDTLVLTSVEHDHPDLYPTAKEYEQRFRDIVGAIPEAGRLIAWGESMSVTEVAGAARCHITTYGLEIGDYTARDITYLPSGIEFDIENHGGILGRLAVRLYGKHNVLNALAATATALSEGLTAHQVIAGAAGFKGTYRRFNLLTPVDANVTVIDDYGHHPTEIATNLEAAKLHFPGRRIVCVFRPHTYTRTQTLLKQWQTSFGQADLVYVTDIEGAREQGMEQKVSGNDIVQALPQPALYTPDRAELIRRLEQDSRPGDVVLCFTVSGYRNLAEDLAQALNR